MDSKLSGKVIEREETIRELKAVVGLDTFHADAPALEPHNSPFEKVCGGVSALLLIGPEETQAGELIDDGILEEP